MRPQETKELEALEADLNLNKAKEEETLKANKLKQEALKIEQERLAKEKAEREAKEKELAIQR